MRNIILTASVALAIFTSTGASARGFSVGVLGSYAIDNGVIDKSIESDIDAVIVAPSGSLDHKPIEIAGTVLFARYDFRNNLFLRTGFESNFTTRSGYYKHDPGPTTSEYFYEYLAYTIPFYLGITLSPDRGRTSIYGGTGFYYSIIEIKREQFIDVFESKPDSDSELFGLSGIIGLERAIIGKIYLLIEFSFYTGSNSNMEQRDDGFGSQYLERYSLPTQQLRLGLKYDF